MRRSRNSVRAVIGGLALVGALIVSSIPVAADPLIDWTAGPSATGDNTYAGFIDTPTNGATVPSGPFMVAGWFVDRTAEGWAGADAVEVWNGTRDGGGTMLAQALVAQNRPDVGAALGNPFWSASGFSAVVNGAQLQSGGNTLSVYARTPGKGWWYKQVNVTQSGAAAPAPAPGAPAPAPAPSAGGPPIVTVIAPKASERIGTRNDYEMRGFALDRAAQPNQGSQGSGIDRVQVFRDGERGSASGVLVGEATLGFSEPQASAQYGAQFANSGWRLTFKPTSFKADAHTLYVYGRSVVTGRETLTTVGIEIFEQ